MKINGKTVRVGHVVGHRGRHWVVTKTQAVKPGKGGAFNQVEMKDIRSGSKLNERFRADEQVERVHLEQRAATFLFREGDLLTFMDSETFEQTAVDAELVGEPAAFLQDGMAVQIGSYEEEQLAVVVPETGSVEVIDADAGRKRGGWGKGGGVR